MIADSCKFITNLLKTEFAKTCILVLLSIHNTCSNYCSIIYSCEIVSLVLLLSMKNT